MNLFIEKGLRGGISYIAKRCSEANNKYLKDYDPTKPSKFILYLDMNNLYGWAMSKYLPYGGFKWLTNVDNFDLNSVSENSSIGYILKVDLEYPDELHALHNYYALVPEKLAISYGMLSDHSKKNADEYRIKVDDVKKLVHNKNLQLYLSLGIKLTEIHRVLKFKHSHWIKIYIDFNTEKRTSAANSFEKNFFKLMINSVYDKKMENLRKRINVRLVNNKKDFLKYISKPARITHKIFDKNFAAVHEIKTVLTPNKPVYVGITVLELSKCLMYGFHYNFIKKHFDAELLFTDTESFTHEIKLEDVYEKHFKHKHLFDFSNFSKDS